MLLFQEQMMMHDSTLLSDKETKGLSWTVNILNFGRHHKTYRYSLCCFSELLVNNNMECSILFVFI